jgi:hypothetical protein
MKQLKTRLGWVFDTTTMVHRSSHSSVELRARMISSYVSVLPDAPNNVDLISSDSFRDALTPTKSLSEANTLPYFSSDTVEEHEQKFLGPAQSLSTTASDENDAYTPRVVRIPSLLKDSTLELASTTCLAASGTIVRISRPSTLPLALPSGYMNELIASSVEPPNKSELPAYTRRSTFSWYRSPTNLSLLGTSPSLNHTDATSKCSTAKLQDSVRKCSSDLRNKVSHPAPLHDESMGTVALLTSYVVEQRPPEIQKTCGELANIIEPVPFIFERIPSPHTAGNMSSAEFLTEGFEATATVDYCQFHHQIPDLLGAVSQKNDENAVLWFSREPFEPISTDFPDIEGESETIKSTIKTEMTEIAPPARTVTAKRYFSEPPKMLNDGNLTKDFITEIVDMPRETPESRNACKIISGFPSSVSTTPSTLASSYSSQESVDFHMDNTFLGTTSARNLEERLHINTEGNITKEDLARAWILCVAAEHSDRRSTSPNFVASGISFIQENDANRALSFTMQRCAKLGRITLLEFLKKFDFDAEGFTAVDKLLSIFGKASLESRERIKASRNGSHGHMLGQLAFA